MPRKYTKKSEYWEKFPKKEDSLENLMQSSQASDEEIIPATAGESYYTQASCPRNVGQEREATKLPLLKEQISIRI